MPIARAAPFHPTRRASLLALAGVALAGCGGGGSDDEPTANGTFVGRSLVAASNGTTYPLNIWLPPNLAAIRDTVAVVYLLDGDARFAVTVDAVQRSPTPAIVVGIGNEAMRSRDYVPANLCTPGGGGEAAFLDFIRFQLASAIETEFGGEPARRILLGHSHGGSFVLYALFNEPPATRHFASYLASDASIDCMNATVYGWESAYHAANATLAVRLHLSWGANLANLAFSQQVQGRAYGGLSMKAQFYAGGHLGMIPMAFGDALAFALA